MAFVLPFLLIVVFGIIEFGYVIFAYSSISQAARNGAENAAQLPPFQTWLDYQSSPPANFPGFRADPCTNSIIAAIESDITYFDGRFNEGRDIADYVTIRYPDGGDTRNLTARGPIEVSITYPVRGLTPLFDLLNLDNGSITLRVTQRRSLENLGSDPTRPRGVACAENVADLPNLRPQP
jgi:hypothetical protein